MINATDQSQIHGFFENFLSELGKACSQSREQVMDTFLLAHSNNQVPFSQLATLLPASIVDGIQSLKQTRIGELRRDLRACLKLQKLLQPLRSKCVFSSSSIL